MTRMMMDCRTMPSEKNCTLVIAGEEDEVLEAATQHAVSAHGHPDTVETRETIRMALVDEPAMATR